MKNSLRFRLLHSAVAALNLSCLQASAAEAAPAMSTLTLPRSSMTLVEVVFYNVRQTSGLDPRSPKWRSYDDGYVDAVTDKPTSGAVSALVPRDRPLAGDLDSQATNPLAMFTITGIRNIEIGGILKVLNDESSGSTRRAFLYIHGFHTTFTYSIINAVRLKIDTDNPKTIAFTWPGNSYRNLFVEYLQAEQLERTSKYYLEGLVDNISRDRKANVVAHSMGARLLFDATIADRSFPQMKNALLMAPDIGVFQFTPQSRFILEDSERAYVYCNPDMALFASWAWHLEPRVGSCLWTKKIPRFSVRFATGANSLDRHSYFIDSKSVVSQIKNITSD